MVRNRSSRCLSAGTGKYPLGRSISPAGSIRRPMSFRIPLPPWHIFSSGGHAAATSTRLWSRNGTRASRPQAIDMLSSRLTGSSIISRWVSRRSTASTAVSAPALARWLPDLHAHVDCREPIRLQDLVQLIVSEVEEGPDEHFAGGLPRYCCCWLVIAV